MSRLAIGRSLFLVGWLVASRAFAQPAGNVTLDAFRPAIDSRGYLTVNASQVLGDRELSFGLGSLDWGHHLLELNANGNSYSIDNMITATLIGAIGVHIGPAELEFGTSLPLRIMSGNRGPGTVGDPGTPNGDRTFAVDGQGLGNIGLHLKTRLLRTSRGARIGLGVIASLYLPTIDPKNRFLGEDQLVPQLVGVLDKELGREQRLRISLNGGIRLRKPTTFTNSDPGLDMAPVTGRSITVGSELPFGVGVAYAVAKQRFDLVGEVFGAVPLGAHQTYQPLEALAGVKLYLARNSFLTLGAGRGLVADQGANPDLRAFIGIVFEPNVGDRDGDGIKDDLDRCPDAPEDEDGWEDEDGCPDPDNDGDRIPDVDDKCPDLPENENGVQDEDGCPEGDINDRDGDKISDDVDRCPDEPEDYDGWEDEDGCPDPDNDGDKILDVDDLCPDEPEDYDGFEDQDGCPDLDNDRDRIPDKDDKCPNEPETYNGFQDQDGCPDHSPHVDRNVNGDIIVLTPINFEYDKAVIKNDSYHILDAVVATMNGYPDIALIEVQGHTDERGDDAYNLDLSERRAAAVMEYLIAHGIAANRLISHGYGETQPIDKHHNEAAWIKNRRVDFVLKKRTEN
ncbi:MAG TPA: OmpA family protein [Kofleriaceae bacterium]|jgi:outer membrane protein OmpA-like peptidoglycan-associated protein|nr:OmpA family protein [Kofleriaceae bacterium]